MSSWHGIDITYIEILVPSVRSAANGHNKAIWRSVAKEIGYPYPIRDEDDIVVVIKTIEAFAQEKFETDAQRSLPLCARHPITTAPLPVGEGLGVRAEGNRAALLLIALCSMLSAPIAFSQDWGPWSTAWSFTTGEGPLPIQLVSFTGRASGSVAILEWLTLSELNNYGFFVERQGSGFIAFVPGHGTTNEPHSYAYLDTVARGIVSIAYRLKQMDLDGSVWFSQLVTVRFTAQQPTPSTR